MYDLTSRSLTRKYRGHKQHRFVIRSSFGGVNDAFIVTGSEDSNIYVYHKDQGNLMLTLSGHAGSVNSVTWNNIDTRYFASASDDHTIRIWGIK